MQSTFHWTCRSYILREERSISLLLPTLSSANWVAAALFSMRKAYFWKNNGMAIECCIVFAHGIAVFFFALVCCVVSPSWDAEWSFPRRASRSKVEINDSFPNESVGSQLQGQISALWSPLSGSTHLRNIPLFSNDADMFSLGEALYLLPDLLDDVHSPAVVPVWLIKAQPLQWVSVPWSWGTNRRAGMRVETLPSTSSSGWVVQWEALLPSTHLQYSTAGIYFNAWGKHIGRKKRSFANV